MVNRHLKLNTAQGNHLLVKIKKNAYITLGILFVLLAFIGAFLPILPSTPFALLAAFFFSRSSAKFHRWLVTLPILGSLISNWEKYRVISPKAKINSTLLMIFFYSWTIYRFQQHVWLLVSIGVIMTGVLVFIWTRKSKIAQLPTKAQARQ